ncbi:MAG: transcription repressor NadR [Oscillospiraceae bacterium]
MTATQRRDAILSALQAERQPVSASALAQRFSVTRQVIVGDIALLRASGSRISATPRGYVLERSQNGLTRQLACRHSAADTEAELNAMVDCGCTVVDVIVEHAVYGQLTAPLQLSSRYDVQQFVSRMCDTEALPLSALTEGVHLHTVLCPDEARFDKLRAALSALGFLLENDGD